QHRDRAETFQLTQRLRAVVRAPAPLRINRPERNVREDDDGRLGGAVLQIRFEPRELILAERAKSVLLDVHDVDEADEMDTVVVEAVPAGAFRIFAETVEIQFPVVAGDVVLAGHIKNLL